jgi:hypothetical protein
MCPNKGLDARDADHVNAPVVTTVVDDRDSLLSLPLDRTVALPESLAKSVVPLLSGGPHGLIVHLPLGLLSPTDRLLGLTSDVGTGTPCVAWVILSGTLREVLGKLLRHIQLPFSATLLMRTALPVSVYVKHAYLPCLWITPVRSSGVWISSRQFLQ